MATVATVADERVGTGYSASRRSATVFPHPIAFNLLPHVDSFLESGYTKEEVKMQDETRKIMHLPDAARFSDVRARADLPRAFGCCHR